VFALLSGNRWAVVFGIACIVCSLAAYRLGAKSVQDEWNKHNLAVAKEQDKDKGKANVVERQVRALPAGDAARMLAESWARD